MDSFRFVLEFGSACKVLDLLVVAMFIINAHSFSSVGSLCTLSLCSVIPSSRIRFSLVLFSLWTFTY